MTEAEAVPAHPDNEYGWEKLYSERFAQAYERRTGMQVRIARFQNCYGAEGTWRGGREKAPAAMCRKVAEVDDGGTIEVWGDGTAVRSYTHVNDMVDGIYLLMQSDLHGAVNIGCPQYVTVDELVATVAEVAGKKINIKHVDGPVGVQSRNFSNARIYSIGWQPKVYPQGGHRAYLSLDRLAGESVVERCRNSVLSGRGGYLACPLQGIELQLRHGEIFGVLGNERAAVCDANRGYAGILD